MEHDLKIITCPNEMVALSAAQGYAQVSASLGSVDDEKQKQKVSAVLVHVDVGTQVSICFHCASAGIDSDNMKYIGTVVCGA